MNSKGHFICSMIKSVLRMAGCIPVIINPNEITLILLGGALFTAEGLGIFEEILDNR